MQDDGKFKPSSYDYILHYFMEHGTTLETFMELPIPYILNILNTQMYIVEENDRKLKENNNGR